MLPAAEFSAHWKSLNPSTMPSWFQDGKLGIVIQSVAYSLPAFAYPDACSEWSWHSLKAPLDGRIESQRRNDMATREYYKKFSREDIAYPQFGQHFKEELFEPVRWANLFPQTGDRNVLLTSMQHDGFALWPSQEASRIWGRP